MTEAETLVQLERLIDALPAESRKRAADWIASKYAAKTAPPELGQTVNRPTWIPVPSPAQVTTPEQWRFVPPITIYGSDTNRIPCAFDNLPPGVYGLVCTCPRCSPSWTATVTTNEPMATLAAVAATWTDEQRRNFTACAPSVTNPIVSSYLHIDTAGCAPQIAPGALIATTNSVSPTRTWS